MPKDFILYALLGGHFSFYLQRKHRNRVHEKKLSALHSFFSSGTIKPMGRRLRGSLDCNSVNAVLMASS